MWLLLTCLLAHVAIAELIPLSWWVPDLTLVGLIVAAGQRPERWLMFSVLAGLATMVWAVRFPGLVFAGYLALGWAVQASAKQWDATDPRIQNLLVGIASTLLTFGTLWLHDRWSFLLVGLASARVVMTCGALPLVRRVLRSRSA